MLRRRRTLKGGCGLEGKLKRYFVEGTAKVLGTDSVHGRGKEDNDLIEAEICTWH